MKNTIKGYPPTKFEPAIPNGPALSRVPVCRIWRHVFVEMGHFSVEFSEAWNAGYTQYIVPVTVFSDGSQELYEPEGRRPVVLVNMGAEEAYMYGDWPYSPDQYRELKLIMASTNGPLLLGD